MKIAIVALALLISATIAAYENGNILIFTNQVCAGRPDDTTFSYWCTPDYTAQRIQALESAVEAGLYDVWAWQQAAERNCSDAD